MHDSSMTQPSQVGIRLYVKLKQAELIWKQKSARGCGVVKHRGEKNDGVPSLKLT